MTIRIASSDARAQDLARLATYFDACCIQGTGDWAVAGPGAVALTNGVLQVGQLAFIGAGTPMVDAMQLLSRPPTPHDPMTLLRVRGALGALQSSVDATWAHDRLGKDRPKAARAFRVARGLAQTHALSIADERTPRQIAIVTPIGAYLVELARYNEAARRSLARSFYAERAFTIYQTVGAAAIESGLRDISALTYAPYRERRDHGVRRGDADVFKRWHEKFLQDRSVRPNHQAVGSALSGLRKAIDWTLGRDLERPDPPNRGR